MPTRTICAIIPIAGKTVRLANSITTPQAGVVQVSLAARTVSSLLRIKLKNENALLPIDIARVWLL
jgi:ribosome biogenesis protein Nip4